MRVLVLVSFFISTFSFAASPQDDARAKFRESFFKSFETYAPELNDRAIDFVDELKYQNLEQMELARLKSAAVKVLPWSDNYWPIYAGDTANRYADEKYRADLDWKKNESYLLANLGIGDISMMSPAEKYDLLVGDSRYTLTRRMIDEGRPYYEHDGKVETWMGICHGWAPASYMMERPKKLISVLAADGRTKIPFYPSDVKALASLLWANGSYTTKYIGGRCNLKDPPKDANGRSTDIDCLDSNPGTWHLAVVNQIGVSGRSFVFDVNYDYEVWNQPVISYSYEYINPKTRLKQNSLKDAAVNRGDFNDPFKLYRAATAEKIVTIEMKVVYGSETFPNHSTEDGVAQDAHDSATYFYDLELDRNGVIVGGEWISENHPDFLWNAAKGTSIHSVGDQWLDRANDQSVWATGSSVPKIWGDIAKQTSNGRQPLARIVRGLIKFAQ